MQLETQEFRAEAKFQRVSPQKARLVLELIKGRRVGEALETVAFTKKGVAPLVEKVRAQPFRTRTISARSGIWIWM